MKTILRKYGVFILLFLFVKCTDKNIPSINILPVENIDWKIKKKCNIVYSNNNSVDTLSGKIKFRGGMSSRYAKHSYTLELDSSFCFNKLDCDDDFIINASYIDKTFMRHKISYDLFREMNADNKAVECTYINVQGKRIIILNN